MTKLKQIEYKNIFMTILIMVVGNLLIAIGANCFLASANIYPTGLLGFSQEVSEILFRVTNLKIDYNLVFLVLNIPIIIFGYFKVGRKFILKTLVSVVIYTIISPMIPEIPLSTFNITNPTTGDFLIVSIIAGALMGAGIGLMLRVGASSGGIDIIAVYISIFKGKSFGIYSLLINTVVLIISYLLTFDIILTALSLVNLYIQNIVIDKIHNSQEKRLLIIITNDVDGVTDQLYKNLSRGITILESVGGYSRNQNNTLLISISKGELFKTENIIKEQDPMAFINVIKADSIVGNFENPYQKLLQ